MKRQLRARYFSPLIVGVVAFVLHRNIYDGTFSTAPIAVGIILAIFVAAAVYYVIRAAVETSYDDYSTQSLVIRDLMATIAIFGVAFTHSKATVPLILFCIVLWLGMNYFQSQDKLATTRRGA